MLTLAMAESGFKDDETDFGYRSDFSTKRSAAGSQNYCNNTTVCGVLSCATITTLIVTVIVLAIAFHLKLVPLNSSDDTNKAAPDNVIDFNIRVC